MLFMGEEYGATTPWQFFTSHPEPELGKATAEGRIKEFERMGWDPAVVPDPQDPETFTPLQTELGGSVRRGPRQAAGAVPLPDCAAALDVRISPSWASKTQQWSSTTTPAGCGTGAERLQVLLNFGDQAVTLDRPGASVLLATDDAVRVDGGSGGAAGAERRRP